MADILPDKLSDIREIYEKSLRNHGASPKGVGWKSQTEQLLRFDILASIITPELAGGGVSVNDLGCGYGSMFSYLDEYLGACLKKYYGYDLSPGMISEAKRLHSSSRAAWECANKASHTADYSFISGTFNVKDDCNSDEWGAYFQDSILQLASKTRLGLAFNCFSTHVDWRADNLYYADPAEYFNFCKQRISPYVTLRHDYPLFEWTILVKMERNPV